MLFRLCNVGVLLDNAAQFCNLDPSYMAETITRQVVASFSQGPQLINDITYWMSVDVNNLGSINYYEAGASAGRLIKIFLDFTINN